MTTLIWRCVVSTFMVLACTGVLAQTTELPAPKGKVILTVTGALAKGDTPQGIGFDAAMIDALPVHSIKTNSPWYKEAVTFSGPLLADVLKAVGAKGDSLAIKALNDYTVQVPASDAQQFKPILARKIDDKALSVREKGPLFLIYPFDAMPELKNDVYYSRSIWQISTIHVK